jgi:hypothetical protein
VPCKGKGSLSDCVDSMTAPTPLTPANEPVYFGCWERPGHFYWSRRMRSLGLGHHLDGLPAAWAGGKVDSGKLMPQTTRAQGAARVHHLDGWTALALHDYTVDGRGNSKSVFLLPGTLDFAAAADKSAEFFPEVCARLGAITEEP